MSRFLRICAVLSAMFFATNVFAAGYTCDSVKQYTSCSAGYYLTGTGVGNSCAKCPDGWTSVANGTTVGAAASCFKTVLLEKNGFSFTLEAGAGTGCKVAAQSLATIKGVLKVYYNTACTLPTISDATSTYYTPATEWATSATLGAAVITTINATTNASNLPTRIYARKTTCAAGAYKSAATVCSDCPANYNSSNVGIGDINSCYTKCTAGTRKSSTTDTSCTTPAGGWTTAAHAVYYGNVSPIFMTPYPFTSNPSTTAAQHNATVSMNASSTYRGAYLGTNPAGYRALQNIPAYGVRVRNSSDNGEYSDMLLNNLIVIPSGTTNKENGVFAINTIISGNTPSDIYGITDTANLDKINDILLTTGVAMPAQSWVEYRFSPIQVSFVQVTLGNNDDNTEIDIQLDISGDGQWVSITGDGAPEYTFDTTDGAYRTLVIPAVAWLPCDAGQYRTSNQNAPWSSITTLASCNTLPAGYWNTGGGINATGSVISGKIGGLIAAGRYGEAGATSIAGSGAVSAGYYSTGGGTSATPTANGDGCVGTSTTCGTIAAGYYGAAGARSSTGSGAVSAGYYSTGGGTSATPTANGDGCVGDGNTCGQLSAEYYSNGGSTTNGATCISGKTCGTCNTSYRANTATGKTAATQCQISCGPGTAVLLETMPCATVTVNRYKTGTALVNYGSKSPTAADVTSGWSADTIYTCPSGYSISGTTPATHDARTDCSISCEPGTQVASANQTCTTPTENNWYTDAKHSVSAGSTSGTNVKNCNTGYSTAATAEATAHDEVADCKIICDKGYYIPTAGAGCVVCPAGKYCEMGGGVSQTATKDPTGDISAGYYSTGGASVANPTASKGCISGQTCGICAKGKYSLAGASACSNVNAGCYADTTGSTTACPKSCSALGGGLYKDSLAGSDAETDCYFATTAGNYMVAATDTAQTKCPIKQYCESETLYYPKVSVLNNGGWNDCPAVDGRILTTYPDDWYSPTSVTASLQPWSTGLKSKSACMANYTVTNPRGRFSIESVKYDEDANKYQIDLTGGRYYTTVNPGFYVLEQYSATRCDGTTNANKTMIYKDAQPCPAGSYCPGYTSMPICSSGTYGTEMGKFSCSDNTSSNYPNSTAGSGNTAGATSVNSCYLTTTSGKFVKTANAAMETCTCGGYCPGSVKVNYGNTGGKTNCTAGTYNNGTGSSASSACKTTSAGYYAGAASCSQTQVNANCWGGAGSKVACPNSCTSPYATSAKGSDDANDCYLTTTAKNYVKTAGAGQTLCAAGTYCPGGSVIYKGGTVSGRSTTGGSTPCPAGSFCAAGASKDTKCVTGSYSAAGASSCTACQDGKTTSGMGQTSCNADCSNKTGAYAWTTASWKIDNTMSNLCIISTCASKYYKNDNACSLCSGLASGFYPNSDNGNSSGTNACRTANLTGSYIASENASSATPCANWKYKGSHTVNYGSTSSCTDCAAAPSALSGVSWIKASGTGWDSYSDCVVTQTPANCTSGTTSRTQTNATTWGDVTLVSTLKSKDGHFASATATACSAAGDGYYAKAGATEQTACATGSYSTKSSASSTCTACPKGRTTSGTGTKYNATANTACSVTCSNAKGVYSWAEPSWSANSVANLCTVSACNADTYYTEKTATGYKNTCTACGANSGNEANHTMSKCICDLGHTIDGKLGSSNTSISGCTRISGIACGVGQYLPAQATTCEDCDAGYYCPAKETSYSFQDYIQGRNECGLGKYQPNKKQTSCLVAEAGYYVPLPGQTKQTKCSNATYQPETGKSSCIACPDPVNLPSGVTVKGKGYWISGGIPTARSGCSVTFNSIDIDDGVMGSSYCYIDEDADSYGMTGTSKNGCYVRRENLTCDGGYYNKTFAESSTATQMNSGKTLATAKEKACTDVESGYWSAANELTRTACATGLVTCGAGKCANEAADCGRKLHAGDQTIYLRSVARTKPALNVKIGNQTFFGALSTSYSSKLKVKNDGTTYSVVNDYQ